MNALTATQWIAIVFYVILVALCLAWMWRFKKHALYAIPPLMTAIHGLVFYSLYFTGAALSIKLAWSPYLRIHGTATFILMMLLMWEKIASHSGSHTAAEAAARTLVSKAERVAEAVLARAVIEADATLTRAAKIADDVYEQRRANGHK